jgi:ABC-2 type transport system ATP-binding protein
VNRVVNFFRAFYDTWDDDYAIDLLKRFDLRWNANIFTLSFGERTKLGLILALSHRPPLLLLDEPMSGLDPVTRREVYTELLDVVQSEDRSIVISSHNLDEIERFADHVGIIKKGRMLVEGTTQSLLERYRLVDATMTSNDIAPEKVGLVVQQRDGTRARVLVDTAVAPVDQLDAYGLADAVEVPLSLDDLFVAMMKS